MSSTQDSSRKYDVIVVGARVAGAATAMLLARQGLDVLAVERGRRGSDTLSTLAVMRCGVLQLHRWGLLDSIREAGTPTIRRTLFHYAEDTLAIDIKPAAGVDGLYAPRRTVLDPILADAAGEAGAEMRFRVTVEDLERDSSGRVTGVVGHDEQRRPFAARAAIVIGADGPKSSVARAVDAPLTKTATSASGVYYGFFRGVGADAFEWAFNIGAGVGLIPTNDGATCVFVSTTAERFKNELRSDPEAGFLRVLGETNRAVAQRVVNAEQTERLRGFGGIVSYLRRPWGPGWALVGDAGYFKDPITAHGITDALRDAELLANAVKEALERPEREAEALAEYETTRDHFSVGLLETTDRIASYDWTVPEVQELHHQLSDAMKAENKLVASFDAPPDG